MVYPRQLTIQLRKRQLISIYPDTTGSFNVKFTGVNPMSLSAVYANEDVTWIDFTDYCDGLQDVAISWSTTAAASGGEVEEGQFLPKRGVSTSLTFEGEARKFIKAHLVDDVAATLNEIEVQITDTNIGSYQSFIVKADDLTWCEFNSLCVFTLNLKQAEPAILCIERTAIADNWQGWFQNEPLNGKKHPRFSYCIEARPNGRLTLQWFLTMWIASFVVLFYSFIYPILFLLVTIVNTMISVINAIIDAVNTLPGVSIGKITPIPTAPTPSDIIDTWANLMIEAAGCGREHPAPLIRDYITNVCDKCGVSYSADTIDIFMAPYLSLTHSDGELYTEPNPHYNACYLFPTVERGIRRFRNWNIYGDTDLDTTTYFQTANAPVLGLSDLLDQLKKEYNARWHIANAIEPVTLQPIPYLFFKRKDFYKEQTALFDFSIGGADRPKIIEGICYSQSDYQIPASGGVLYKDDPSDKCGHEALRQYNGNPLSYANTINDPHFYGIKEIISDFAPAKFNCDGASTNYLYDALQTCYTMSLILAPFTAGFSVIVTGLIQDALGDMIQRYADFALLLQTETVSVPKLLIWDGKLTTGPNRYMNARAVRNDINIAGTLFNIGHTGKGGTYPSIGMPDVNPLYPVQAAPSSAVLTTLSQPSTVPAVAPFNMWDYVNPPLTKVIGKIIGTPSPAGVYQVHNSVGTVKIQQPAILVNYPLYFTPYFKGTMWDWFHWIDHPIKNPQLHKLWSLKIPLCKSDIQRLGLTLDAADVKLLATIILDTPFYNQGVLTSVTAAYKIDGGEDNDVLGQTIELKGYV